MRQSHIDPSVWSVVPGPPTPQGVWEPVDGVTAIGWVVVYVDDYLVVGSDLVIDSVTETIKAKWQTSEQPTLQYGSNASVAYLSVDVKATPEGFFLSQPSYTEELLEKWSMQECNPIGSLDEVSINECAYEDEEEAGEGPPLYKVREAQRLAGGLNWLATRSRPDIAFYVSQLASAATREPFMAVAMGKRCLRYLAGTRQHGVSLFPHGTSDTPGCRSHRAST